MYFKLQKGENNCIIIEDTHGVDHCSLKNSLDFLYGQSENRKKTLVLSDIHISGQTYKVVTDILSEKNDLKIIIIGEGKSLHYSFLKNDNVYCFDTVQAFEENLSSFDFKDETILLKGEPSFEWGSLIKKLSLQSHQTVLEVNMNNVLFNLNYYRSKINPSTKIMVIVKALAYGVGGNEIARFLQQNRVDYFAVAYADEGVELRKNGIHLPILVLNVSSDSFDGLIKYDLEPAIYSHSLFDSFQMYVQRKKIQSFPIHIEIDSGMKRLGFSPDEIEKLVTKLQMSSLKAISFFSHLAASEDPAKDDFTNTQISVFKESVRQFKKELSYDFMVHILNSSGIIRHTHAQFDMVRLGIGLYGLDGSFSPTHSPLKPVVSLTARISQIKKIRKGETVGYGAHFYLKKGNGEIAIIGLGYADGLPRIIGNGKGKVKLPNGRRVSIVGNVCMDMAMIDVTDENIKEGGQVVLFDDIESTHYFAQSMGTIPYEVLTSISPRIKKVWIY